jgi:hypothetical protein
MDGLLQASYFICEMKANMFKLFQILFLALFLQEISSANIQGIPEKKIKLKMI